MAKRKKKRKPGKQIASRQRKAPQKRIEQIEMWVMTGNLEQASEAVAKLTRHYPDDPAVLSLQLAVLMERGQVQGAIPVAQRLVALEPTVPEHQYNLMLTYARNGLVTLAFQAGQELIRRWPHHPSVPEVRELVGVLESDIAKGAKELELPPESVLEVLSLHEQAQMAMQQQKIGELERIVQKIRESAPHFIAPLNNLALGYIFQGRIDEAIEIEQEVRERDPDNVNALSNLIHALVLAGRQQEAQEIGGRLKDIHAANDVLVKKLEGLSWAGMDQAVLDAFRQAKESDEPPSLPVMGLAYHYAAVAAARLGDEKQAREWWTQALALFPGLEKAQENLEDLHRPPGERQGAWPFTMMEWIPEAWLKDLTSSLLSSQAKSEQRLRRMVTRFLQKYPQIIALAPVLLERGDAQARDLVYNMAVATEHPDLQAALRDFALGRWGTDEQRLQAAQYCVDHGLLPRGQIVRMWQEGEQRDLLLFGWEISFEPLSRLPPAAERLMERAVTALREQRLDEAEEALQEGLKLLPDHPSFLQNLAVLYASRGEEERAKALIRQIVERNPDYAIGRCNLATMLAREGKVEEATRLVEPVTETERFHISEFAALCHAQVEISLARNQREGAEAWMQMLEQVDPEHPILPTLRRRVRHPEASSLLRRLWSGQR